MTGQCRLRCLQVLQGNFMVSDLENCMIYMTPSRRKCWQLLLPRQAGHLIHSGCRKLNTCIEAVSRPVSSSRACASNLKHVSSLPEACQFVEPLPTASTLVANCQTGAAHVLPPHVNHTVQH
eukprot:230695-Chlamydomonas_euryale.AAC.2